MTLDPFSLPEIPAVARWPLERALAIPALRRLYRQTRTAGLSRDSFAQRVLHALDIRAHVSEPDVAAIPPRGPVVIAANHPHGALDGLLLLDLVSRVRPDVRVLANRVLARVPELRDCCFFVDPFGGAASAAKSRAGLRAAHLWLRRGGALIVFPAGEVGHRHVEGALVDGAWKTTFERLALTANASIVPAHIEGRNSRLFYAAGRIHPRLRTALLGRELLWKRGDTIPVTLGAHHAIAREIARLEPEACLAESGSLRVFCAAAAEIPATLREIGRLRETAFRAVGEGTGRAVDLDPFDASYLHLFAWDARQQQVVGAYRMGATDRVAAGGVHGLYTRTLFRYDGDLLARLGAPAIELGRSFVRAEYQRSSNALLLLWRGIGAFLARHPRYRFLFGPVTVSARYRDTSRAMLVEFLRRRHRHDELAPLVDSMRPPQLPATNRSHQPGDVDALDRLIAESEHDGRGIPVLLRHYLKLNARLLSVSVDPDFGDALDALMIVDLRTAPPAILQRYLGKSAAAAFIEHHERHAAAAAA